MSLADKLLADFDSDEDEPLDIINETEPQEEIPKQEETVDEPLPAKSQTDEPETLDINAQASLDALKTQGNDVTSQDLISRVDFKNITDINSISNLMARLTPILRSFEHTKPENTDEHPLFVEANSYSVEIDNEIIIIHQFIKEHYKERFPELETMVPYAVPYAKIVLSIGNDVKADLSASNLKSITNATTVLMISMAAVESKGKPLSDSELAAVNSACELLLELDSAKGKITNFVSNRLSQFAPNLTAIIGAHTAAQLLGIANGLKNLASTPSANIPALGSKAQVGIGFGHVGIRQRGFLYHSPLVENIPAQFKTQAMRIISGKLVLAARVDLSASIERKKRGDYKVDDSMGANLKKQIVEKINKLLEPPENKAPKALPAPVDKPSKKRAGKKIRKFKEQFKMTELQRVQNRMAFGTEEAYDNDLAELGGTIGSSNAKTTSYGSTNTDRIRAISSDNKFKAKMSKNMTARLNGVSGKNKPNRGDIFSNGMHTSLNFSATQGIELPDPSKFKKASNNENSQKWFMAGTFTQIEPKGSSIVLEPKKRPAESAGDQPNKRSKQ